MAKKGKKKQGESGADEGGFVPYAPRTRTRVALDVLSVVLGFGAAATIINFVFAKVAAPIIRPLFMSLLHALTAYGIVWGLLVRPKRYHADALGLAVSRATCGQAGLGFLFGGALAALAVGIAVLAKGLEIQRAPSFQAPSAVEIGVWVAAAFFAAIFEEIVFRSGTVATLRTAYPRHVALIVPGVIFALGHIGNPYSSPLAVANTILAGVFLGLLFLHPKNEPTVPGLGLAVGAHAGWNLALRLLGVPVSGFVAQGRFFQLFSVNETWSGGAYGVEGGLAGTIAFGVGAALVYADLKRREPAATS